MCKSGIILIIVSSILFIVVGFIVWKSSSSHPAGVLAREATLIDLKTKKLITLTSGEWSIAGKRNGLYKHPETGKYTMAVSHPCEECGALTSKKISCPGCGSKVEPPPPPLP